MNIDSRLAFVFFLLLVHITSSPLVLTKAFVGTGGGSAMTGSVKGGTKITIVGTGFATDSTQVQVFVGSFPCVLEDGTMPTSISCITSDSTNNGLFTGDSTNLPIRVFQFGQPFILYGYTFSYLNSKSPQLYSVYPSSSFPNDIIRFIGIHKITHSSTNPRDQGQLDPGLSIDSQICKTIEIAQNIAANAYQPIICRSSSEQQGGKYSVEEAVLPGIAKKSIYMEKSTLTPGQYFQHIVIPVVQSVTPNSGFPSSQDIIIKGRGFSADKDKVSVNVDGTKCMIESASANQISCKLKAREQSDSQRLEISNSSNYDSQVNGFIGGSGFQYYKYNVNNLRGKHFSALKDAIYSSSRSIYLVEKGVLGELETFNEQGTYGKVLKGYFYAPVSGQYIFRGASDDNFGLFISDTYGTATVNGAPYIYSYTHTNHKDNYYYDNRTQSLGAPRYFQAGKYYYMQLYHVNIQGNGYVKISVEIPNQNSDLKWQRYQINQFAVTYTNDPQIRTFTLESGSIITGGTFKLKIVRSRPFQLRPYYQKQVVIAYNASASQFWSALNAFDTYYDFAVELDIFDSNGNLNTSESGVKYVWTATIRKMRPESQVLEYFDYDLSNIQTDTTVTFTQEQVHPHGPLMSGTFMLQIGDTLLQVYDSLYDGYIQTNIPYNIEASALQAAIRRISDEYKNIEVYRTGNSQVGFTWVLFYYRISYDMPDLLFDDSMLEGGKTGTKPHIHFFETRKHSTNIVVNPVDSRYLYTAEHRPYVHVTVNDVLGACMGDCYYEFKQYIPQVTMQEIVNNQLSVEIREAVQPVEEQEEWVDPFEQFDQADFINETDLIENEQNCTDYLINCAWQDINGTMYNATLQNITDNNNTNCTQNYTAYLNCIENNSNITNTTNITEEIDTDTIRQYFTANYTNDQFIVKIDGQECTNIIGTFADFVCDLPPNANGDPMLRAGSHNVEVYVYQQGLVAVDSSIQTINIPLTITGLSPSTGIGNGGYQIVITGSGFPLDVNDAQITICGSTITPKQISNTQTVIVAPYCPNPSSPQTLQYTYNSITASTTFTYTATITTLSITDISPHSASPVKKGIMQITGTGFPTSSSPALHVYLSNSSGNVYQMRVLQNTAEYIKCGIPGGLPGLFEVIVEVDGIGNAIPIPQTANDFVYEIVIENVTPESGFYYGGTQITITGRNFSPDIRENLISISHQMNWFCSITEISTTTIKCRTPPWHQDWPNTTYTQDVIVGTRLILDSTCQGVCQFTYEPLQQSIELQRVSASSVTSGVGTLILTVNNFDGNTSLVAVFTNYLTKKETVVNPNAINIDSIEVNVPELQAGYYDVKVRLDPKGDSNSERIKFNTVFNPETYTGSVEGGTIVLKGHGLPDGWPSNLYSIRIVSNSKEQDVDVVSAETNRLQLKVPAGVNNQRYTIYLTNPLQITKSATFTQLSSSTPIVTIPTVPTLSPGPNSLTLTSSINTAPSKLYTYNRLQPEIMTEQPFTFSANQISLTATFTSGKHSFAVWYNQIGWASIIGEVSVTRTGTYSVVTTQISYAGGELIVTGDDINENAVISVGGLQGKVKRYQAGYAVFEVPGLKTEEVVDWYPVLKQVEKISAQQIINDGGSNADAITDDRHHTEYSSNNAECYVGIDVGQSLRVKPTRIRYFPFSKWAVVSDYLSGAQIQASLDDLTYQTLHTVGPSVHSGWNSFLIDTADTYRYFRIKHDSSSGCKIAQFEVYGHVYNDISVTAVAGVSMIANADVKFSDGFNVQTWNGIVVYKDVATPRVTSVTPDTGSVFGEYNIVLTGENLGEMDIIIDGIQCVVITHSSTSVTCQVGPRPQLPSQTSFSVSLDGNKAVLQQQFKYVMRWSDIRTWGTDLPPVQGDLVYVPKGMTLYVDQTTPRVDGIIVQEGKIIFADEGTDIQVHANLITVVRGQFQAGTKQKPYQGNLKFIMYGGYYGKQQPMFGNKGIGCFECKFSMYGKVRPVTWTMIQNTILAGEDTFDVIEPVDWVAGEKIVIASTSYNHNQAEERTIISVVSNTTITVDKPFKFMHFGGVETYGSDTLEMRAEVGLLTRNIKMMGDQTSKAGIYGSHLMMAGSSQNGMVSHIGYTQFTHCGQPRIVGRYCMHFHMNGDVADSQVTGNAVHHSFARVITIHAVQFLVVKDNVGYRVKGHNFFIEDGVEIQNVLDHNLAIGSLMTFNMMQTDISVASFWVTNPLNDLINNHAAGGDFYGFWYEIKSRPDGPSSRSDVCPVGMPLGASHDNVAHSYVRFGLRIFQLAPRKHPCRGISASNPSIQTRFYNYVTYKIGEAGLLAENVRNMVFENFKMAQSRHAGMQFYVTSEAVIARDMAIIGVTQGNSPSNSGGSGAIGPRTGGWKMQNIRFYNFPGGMTVLKACSGCDLSRMISYQISQIQCTNVTGSYLVQNGLKRVMIYDLDNTFASYFNSESRTQALIIPFSRHVFDQPACQPADIPSKWDNGLICNSSVTVKTIFVNYASPWYFINLNIHIQKIDDQFQPLSSTGVTSFKPKHGFMGWQLPFITGSVYKMWWGNHADFIDLQFLVTSQYTEADQPIIFKFDYLERRELFDVADMVGGGKMRPYHVPLSENMTHNSSCSLGQYTHDPDQKTLTLCYSGIDKIADRQHLSITGIRCRYLCPSPTPNFVKETFIRKWSNVTQWPNGVLPQDGDNVTIPGDWNIIMDIQPAEMKFFHIDGDVFVPPQLTDVTIVAESIWIRAGSFNAGTATEPHEGKIQFIIIGNKTDFGYVLHPEIAGTKLFLVTGRLMLYGATPSITWTRLNATAFPGDTEIQLIEDVDWSVGDWIVLGPSFSSSGQHEKVIITNISGNTIAFTPELNYTHYGSAELTIDNQVGQLDTRTAVGLLTRNIRIISGEDTDWGFRLMGYSYLDGQNQRLGQLVLQGVQVQEGGQYDNYYPALSLKLIIGSNPTKIIKSSFHNCMSYCIEIENSRNLQLTNNVFYIGRINHVKALGIAQYSFKNNLMIAAVSSSTMSGLIACYGSWDEVDGSVQVSHNVCQGSSEHGFAIQFDACSASTSSYSNNVASSAPVCFIFNKIPSSSCMKASGVRAFACGIGQISHPPGASAIVFEKFIIADSGRAVSLRYGNSGNDNSAYFRNSYITAISRPDCSYCYGSSTNDCTGNYAVRMLVVTVNGQHMPSMSGSHFDVICKEQSFDAKTFIDNVIFDNYRQTYPTLPQCHSNVVFVPHPAASDITGSNNLRNTVCTNCELSALAYFSPPNPGFFGWFGGCGNMLCTGKNNYLVSDFTGGFLPMPGVLIANNSQIGDNADNCSHVPEINGHYCERTDFGVIEYQSRAPDFNTRIMWPVYLKYDGGLWNTSTNGWREWEWAGSQPLNKRLGRFISVVELSQVYNMTFQSEPPIDMVLQFQRRSPQGNNSQYIVIKLHYPRPNSIRVMNKTSIMKPITLRNDGNQESLNTSVCGSNKFFYRNYTIHFVLTADKSCHVRVSLTNTIQLTARFSMPINRFFDIDGQTKFIDRMCALLHIDDTSRLKIVGVYMGSVQVIAVIEEPVVDLDDATNHDNSFAALQMKQLQVLLSQLYEDGLIAAAFPVSEGFGQISFFQSQVYDHQIAYPTDINTDSADFTQNTDDALQQQLKTLGLIVGLVLGILTIIVAILAGLLYIIRKRAKVIQIQSLNSQQKKLGLSFDEDNSVIHLQKR